MMKRLEYIYKSQTSATSVNYAEQSRQITCISVNQVLNLDMLTI